MCQTSAWGVEWSEDFHEEESEGLLSVLHLSSDWLGSPSAPPYKCQVHRQLECLGHPELLVRMRLTEPCQSIWISGRQGERLSESSRLHMLSRPAGGLIASCLSAWAVGAIVTQSLYINVVHEYTRKDGHLN